MPDLRQSIFQFAQRTRRSAYATSVELVSRSLARRTRSADSRESISAYWFRPIPNFGDFLTPWILGANGITPRYADADSARLVGAGSLLEMLPKDFSGFVWGTGSMYGEPLNFPNARWLAVRGYRTQEVVDRSDIEVGDPGLLVSEIVPAPARERWSLGIVPHRIHRDQAVWGQVQAALGPERCKIIDVRQHPSAVIKQIASCEQIVTTSLHGLITADSYGIPAAWLELEPPLKGGAFKFYDHESVASPDVNRRIDVDSLLSGVERHRFAAADADRVRRAKDGLLRTLSLIPREQIS